jgi:hypothetical protein
MYGVSPKLVRFTPPGNSHLSARRPSPHASTSPLPSPLLSSLRHTTLQPQATPSPAELPLQSTSAPFAKEEKGGHGSADERPYSDRLDDSVVSSSFLHEHLDLHIGLNDMDGVNGSPFFASQSMHTPTLTQTSSMHHMNSQRGGNSSRSKSTYLERVEASEALRTPQLESPGGGDDATLLLPLAPSTFSPRTRSNARSLLGDIVTAFPSRSPEHSNSHLDQSGEGVALSSLSAVMTPKTFTAAAAAMGLLGQGTTGGSSSIYAPAATRTLGPIRGIRIHLPAIAQSPPASPLTQRQPLTSHRRSSSTTSLGSVTNLLAHTPLYGSQHGVGVPSLNVPSLNLNTQHAYFQHGYYRGTPSPGSHKQQLHVSQHTVQALHAMTNTPATPALGTPMTGSPLLAPLASTSNSVSADVLMSASVLTGTGSSCSSPPSAQNGSTSSSVAHEGGQVSTSGLPSTKPGRVVRPEPPPPVLPPNLVHMVSPESTPAGQLDVSSPNVTEICAPLPKPMQKHALSRAVHVIAAAPSMAPSGASEPAWKQGAHRQISDFIDCTASAWGTTAAALPSSAHLVTKAAPTISTQDGSSSTLAFNAPRPQVRSLPSPLQFSRQAPSLSCVTQPAPLILAAADDDCTPSLPSPPLLGSPQLVHVPSNMARETQTTQPHPRREHLSKPLAAAAAKESFALGSGTDGFARTSSTLLSSAAAPAPQPSPQINTSTAALSTRPVLARASSAFTDRKPMPPPVPVGSRQISAPVVRQTQLLNARQRRAIGVSTSSAFMPRHKGLDEEEGLTADGAANGDEDVISRSLATSR